MTDALEAEIPSLRRLPDPPYLAPFRKLRTFGEIEEVMKSPDFIQAAHRESTDFFGDSILLIDGDEHFARRRLESPLFARAALESYERTALHSVIDQVMAEVEATRDPDGVVRADVVALTRVMLHRITALITGIDGVDTPERTERFRWFIERLGEAVTVEWSTRDHAEVIAEGLAIQDEFIAEFYGPSLARRRALVERHRRGEIAMEDMPRDLLSLLLLHWDDSWDESLPLREATLFLVAATQTTTHATPHVVRHLDQWLPEHPEYRDELTDPDFLGKAAAESLRLHLPSPALMREALTDVTLKSGLEIEKGERVALIIQDANRESDTFGPDATAFNPLRDQNNVKPWGLTFGAGEHLCIGRPLVLGVPGRSESEGTFGTLVLILTALYGAGAELDPDAPPEYVTASHHDAYSTFPVILTAL